MDRKAFVSEMVAEIRRQQERKEKERDAVAAAAGQAPSAQRAWEELARGHPRVRGVVCGCEGRGVG
jgi:hypothetical protein